MTEEIGRNIEELCTEELSSVNLERFAIDGDYDVYSAREDHGTEWEESLLEGIIFALKKIMEVNGNNVCIHCCLRSKHLAHT